MNIAKTRHRPLVHYLVGLIPVLLLAGCGGGGGADGGGMGSVGVSITDAPACGFDAVNVTVRQIRIHRNSAASNSAAGWADINLTPARKINLLDLNNGVLENLGETALETGQYTQVRLVLVPNTGGHVANSVVLTGPATEVALDTPSAVQSGIKLIHPFNVRGNERTDLLLDFDACKSIVTRGNGSYALKPVIRIIPIVLNGIKGAVDTALLSSHVVVSAQLGGEVIHATVPNPQSGEFLLARFDPGSYDLVVTADGRATGVIKAVPVSSASSIAVVSTMVQPITLPASITHTASGTVMLNPASTTDAVAFVVANQTVDAGVTVTVKFKAADLMNGAYAMILPSGAPLLGSYGTGTLPIALTLVPAAAGQYTIGASADGYATQVAAEDLSSADVTQNFTLSP